MLIRCFPFLFRKKDEWWKELTEISVQDEVHGSAEGIDSDVLMKANRFYKVGLALLADHRIDDARDQFDKLIELSKQHEYKRGESDALVQLALISRFLFDFCNDWFRSSGDDATALHNFREALTIASMCDDPSLAFSCLSQIGCIFRNQGRLQEAATCFEESYEAALRTANVDGQVFSLSILGNIYQSLGHHDEAIRCHFKSMCVEPRNHRH
jgi:tetratricopeptide (TPR) repeat protein